MTELLKCIQRCLLPNCACRESSRCEVNTQYPSVNYQLWNFKMSLLCCGRRNKKCLWVLTPRWNRLLHLSGVNGTQWHAGPWGGGGTRRTPPEKTGVTHFTERTDPLIHHSHFIHLGSQTLMPRLSIDHHLLRSDAPPPASGLFFL